MASKIARIASTIPTGWETALSDQSDVTQIQLDAPASANSNGPWHIWNPVNITLPMLATVQSVLWWQRAKNFTSGVRSWLETWEGYVWGVGLRKIGLWGLDDNAYENTIAGGGSTDPLGEAWTLEKVNSVEIWVRNVRMSDTPATAHLNIADVWQEVYYLEVPRITAVAPAYGTTVANTSKPAITWHFNDPELHTQERYKVRVFTQAQYQAADFNPGTSPAFWESGEVFSATGSILPGIALANGVYRAYITAADARSQGVYGWGNLLRHNEWGVEASTAGWTSAGGAPTLARTTSQVYEGAAALQMTATQAANSWAYSSRLMSVTAGRYYGAEFYAKGASTARRYQVWIEFYGTGGTLGSGLSPFIQGTTTSWTRVQLEEVVAPPNATTCRVFIAVEAPAVGEVHYFDSVGVWGTGPDSSSNWTWTEFTVAVVPPPTPAITAAGEQANGRIRLQITPGSAMPVDEFNIEFSDDFGTTWEPLSGADPLPWPNLLTANEASIEINSSGWEDNGGNASGFPQRSLAQALDGVASMLVEKSSTGTTVGLLLTRFIPATSSQRYFAWSASRANTTGRLVSTDLWWANASQAFLQSNPGAAITDTTTGWTWGFVDATSPSFTAYLRERIQVYSPATGERHYMDMMRVSAVPVIFYDYTARSGISRRYRISGTLYLTAGSLTSATGAGTAAQTITLSNWHLMDPSDPENLSMDVFLEGDAFDLARSDDAGEFQPLGRKTKVVVADSPLKGDEFTVTFFFATQAEYDEWRAMDENQRTLLLRNPRGEAWYLRFVGERRISRSGVGNTAIRMVTVRAVEQIAP